MGKPDVNKNVLKNDLIFQPIHVDWNLAKMELNVEIMELNLFAYAKLGLWDKLALNVSLILKYFLALLFNILNITFCFLIKTLVDNYPQNMRHWILLRYFRYLCRISYFSIFWYGNISGGADLEPIQS